MDNAKLKPFYFTYSIDGKQDYTGGHIIIWAIDSSEARKFYKDIYGLSRNGLLNFAFQYDKETWDETGESNYGHGFNDKCYEEINKPQDR